MLVLNLPRNAAWALWMTLVTAMPAVLVLGPLLSSAEEWKRVLILRKFHSSVEAVLFFSFWSQVIGNLAGCLAVPLDAKVTWKLWPCPQVLGGSALHLVAVLIASLVYRSRVTIRDVPLRRASKVAASRIAASSPAKTASPKPKRSSPVRNVAAVAAAEPATPKTPSRRRTAPPAAASPARVNRARSRSRTPISRKTSRSSSAVASPRRRSPRRK